MAAEADETCPGSGTDHVTAGTVIAVVPIAVRTFLETAFIELPPDARRSASGGTGREPVR
ncbi:hypothetical protein GCM10029978_003130 [Actinoallomurus acanthiterrae]